LFSKNRVLKFKQATLGKRLYIFLKSQEIECKVNQVKNHYEIILDKKFKEKKNIFNEVHADEINAAILGALFVAKGSANSPKSKFYHLEVRTNGMEQANELKKIFEKYGLEPKIYKGANRIVVYLKKSAHISDFFKIINAHEGVMYFEDIRINRDFSNALVRLNTIDIVNTKKAVEASQKQIEKINQLINTDILKQYHQRYREIAELRLEHVESNLQELTNIYNEKYKTYYTKSAVNH
jgi:DNA-binding protein WhiA